MDFISFVDRWSWYKPVKVVTDGTVGLQNMMALTLGLK